jgi:hypothetical protein
LTTGEASLISQASTVSAGNRASRALFPTVFGNSSDYSGISLSSTQSKFGGKSLYVEPKTASILPNGLVYNTITNQWVAFSSGYTWKTSDLGQTWTRTTNNLTSWSAHQVQFLNSQYVVIADDSTIKTSPDGNTWTTFAAPSLAWYTSSIGYANGIWFIFYKTVNTLYVATSPNLTTWTSKAQIFNFSAGIYSWYIKDIAYGGSNVYVSLSASVYNVSNPANPLTSNRVLKFADISSATSPTSLVSSQATYPNYIDYVSMESTNLTTGSGPLLISGKTGNSSAYYTYYYNGTSTSTLSATTAGEIFYINDQWVKVGSAKVNILTTTNGSTWTDTGVLSRAFSTSDTSASATHLVELHRGSLNYTDLVSYNTTNIVSNGNYPAYIEYNSTDNTDWSSWKTIDFWLYVPTQATSASIPIISQTEDSADSGWEITLFANTTNFQLTAYNGIDNTQLSTSGKTLNNWHHVRVVNNSSVWAMYFDGTKVSSQSYTPLAAITAPLRIAEGYISFGDEAHNGYYLDEVLVSDQLLTNPVTETTITIPTAPYINSIDVDALFHYDISFDDDAVTVARYATAQLTVNSALTFDGAKTASTAVALTSSVSLSASALKIAEGYTALQAQFVLSTSALDLDFAQADLAVVSSLSAAISITKHAESTISCNVSVNAQPLRILEGTVSTDSIASELVAVSKIGDFLITLDSSSSMSIDAVKIAIVEATVDCNATTTIEGKLFVGASASIISSSQLSCAISRTRTTRCITGVVAYLNATPGKQFGAIANLVSIVNIVAFTTGTNQGSANLVATANSLTTVDRFRDITSSLESNTTTYADTLYSVTRNTSSAINVASTLSLDISRTRPAAISTDSIASELVAVSKIGDFLVTIEQTSSVTIDADLIASANANINVSTQLSIDADEIQQLDAQLVSAFTIIAQGDTNINGAADLSLTSSLLIDANRTRNEQAAINASSEVLATALRIKELDSSITAQATQTAIIGKITNASAALNSVFTISTGGNANFQANLVAFSNATLLARVGAIHIDPTLTYKIPKESRLTFINAETRLISIGGDNRDYRIKQETRNHTIREETRLYNIRS